jgi:predicted DNA-binding transcriptional regulator
MSKDQAIGAAIVAVCVIVAVAFVGLLLFYDPYIASFLNLGANTEVRFWLIATPVAVAFVAILAIGAWIGWTMATTPPPKSIEEITAETETENKTAQP